MRLNSQFFLMILVGLTSISCVKKTPPPALSGELREWHKVTLTFVGPETAEAARPNPFRDYRLVVTFSRQGGGAPFEVPGYYASDGDAANSGADKGNTWRVHYCPDQAGLWRYAVSFRKGDDIAISENLKAGQSAGYMDGMAGELRIEATDKTAPDFRAAGQLKYVGKHHLRFAGTGEYFLKCGADAPENFLAYADFDGDFKTDGHKDDLIKTWQPHIRDWMPGDPTWRNGMGKGIVGALNYLASKGMNTFSFLTMNIAGDDQNVFPYVDYETFDRFDCSKLDQWEIVFEYADRLGLHMHFKTQEQENDQLLDGGELGINRRLYYRELIARFGHHLALSWNLGEENTNSSEQMRAFLEFFAKHDPYHHHLDLHTFPESVEKAKVYLSLLGPPRENAGSLLTGASLQCRPPLVFDDTKYWLAESEKAGRPWVISNDEQGTADVGVMPDADNSDHDIIRKEVLWGNLLAGGAGVELYFGYKYAHSDLTCQDFRSRDRMWDQGRFALGFFRENRIPFWDMSNRDSLSAGQNTHCLGKPGEIYVVYLMNGTPSRLDLREIPGAFSLAWFNPRTGLFVGEARTAEAGAWVNLGSPPADPDQDWVVLIRRLP
jgi:hypothetical protein